jgi:hypothetical protein
LHQYSPSPDGRPLLFFAASPRPIDQTAEIIRFSVE